MNNVDLSRKIDQTILKADASIEEIKRLCKEVKEYGFACAMVNPSMVKYCKEALEGTEVVIGTVIGFPLGQNTLKVKLYETKIAIEDGATEIDYVLNISELVANNVDYIKQEMQEITKLSHENKALCKVILETCYLTDEHIENACKIAVEVGIDFVKTSTGFGSAGATLEHITLMKKIVGDKVKVKASGGVRTLEFAEEVIKAGADRIGTSNGIALIKGLESKDTY